MHTDDLVTLLGNNAPASRGDYLRSVRVALAATLIAAVVAVAFTLGLRSDFFGGLFDDPNRVFKYGFMAALVAANGLAWWRHGQPGRSIEGPIMFVLLFAGWLLILCVRSFYVTDFEVLKAAVISKTAFSCIGVTVSLAVAATVVLAKIGRAMAPEDVKSHAYLSALFAGSIGAFAYSLRCPNDQPLYIATWYGLAIAGYAFVAAPVLARKFSW